MSMTTNEQMPKQLKNWRKFDLAVEGHILNYVIPQYGDESEELAKDWSAEDCVKQAQTYLARFARGQRKGEEQLDMLKAAHWMQKAWTRLQPKSEDKGRPVPEHGSGP
jgi:hypothetical protein